MTLNPTVKDSFEEGATHGYSHADLPEVNSSLRRGHGCNVSADLRKAPVALRRQRDGIGKQIAAIRSALSTVNSGATTVGGGRRKPMSAAARKAVAKRMKAYWAKREAETAKKQRPGVKLRGVTITDRHVWQ